MPGLLGPPLGLVLLDLPLGGHRRMQDNCLLLLHLPVAPHPAQPQLNLHQYPAEQLIRQAGLQQPDHLLTMGPELGTAARIGYLALQGCDNQPQDVAVLGLQAAGGLTANADGRQIVEHERSLDNGPRCGHKLLVGHFDRPLGDKPETKLVGLFCLRLPGGEEEDLGEAYEVLYGLDGQLAGGLGAEAQLFEGVEDHAAQAVNRGQPGASLKKKLNR